MLFRSALVFPVIRYGCESWTIKKAEHQRINAFELWCWRILLRVPQTAKRSNQFILKEISPGCSLEGMMLKLKLQYFGHLTRRVDSLEKSLIMGGIGGRRRRGPDRWPASGHPAPPSSTPPTRTACPAAQARRHPGQSRDRRAHV